MKEEFCYQIHVTDLRGGALYVCCESQFRRRIVKTSSIKRRHHLHIYDSKNPKNIIHTLIGAELSWP